MAIPISQLLRTQRRQVLRLNQEITDRQLAQVLRDAAADGRQMARELATFPGFGALTRAAQLRVISDATSEVSGALWNNAGRFTREGIFQMADLAALQSLDLDKVLGMPTTFVRGYEEGIRASARISAKSIIARRRFGYTLSERVFRNQELTRGRLNRVIESGLVNNLSARELSRQVGQFIDPNTPGGASYAAMRLARTEINNAHHWVSSEQMASRPWIDAVDWNLSGSHPRPDICDDIANSGPYNKEEIPDKPHPQCLCYVTPVLPNEDEFLDSLLGGEYNDWLEDKGRDRIICNSSCKVVESDGQEFQRWDTIDEQEEWLEESFDYLMGEFTEDELDALDDYAADSNLYNLVLRGIQPSTWSDEVIADRLRGADALAGAIDLSPVDGNIITYRGVKSEVANKLLKGNRFTDKGFVSTSLNQQVAEEFAESTGYVLEIQVPDGTRGLGLSGASGFSPYPEQELILQRGSTFQILAVDHVARKILTRVVGQ